MTLQCTRCIAVHGTPGEEHKKSVPKRGSLRNIAIRGALGTAGFPAMRVGRPWDASRLMKLRAARPRALGIWTVNFAQSSRSSSALREKTVRRRRLRTRTTKTLLRSKAREPCPKHAQTPLKPRRKCADALGCEMTLSVANISGLCQRHARWAGARTEVAEQRREKTNGHANGAHAANGSARRTNGNGHAPANGSNRGSSGAVGVLPALAADRVDQLLATLTARDKARIALAWLRGEL